MKKLKILFLITDLGKGGAERYLLDVCHALKSYADIEFHIGVLLENNEYESLSQGLPISYLNYQTPGLIKRGEQNEYRKLLKSFKPDIVHTHRFLAEYLSSYYIDKRIKYVCHGHDNMIQFGRVKPVRFLQKKHLINFLEKRQLIKLKYRRVPTTFLANSKHTLDYFKHSLPSYKNIRIKHLSPGFNFERFKAAPRTSIDLSKPIQLINIGSMQAKKNHGFILQIGNVLKQRNKSFHIHLLGDGLLYNELRNQVVHLNLEKEVTFHGNQDNVELWLQKADLYVHTARYEPFGLVLLEAMATALPCICLDGKGNRELIVNGKTGYLIQNEDADQFADKILYLAENNSLYAQQSREVIRYAEQFDIGKTTENLVAFYRNLVSS